MPVCLWARDNQLASHTDRALRLQELINENTLLALEKNINSFKSQDLNTEELFQSMARCRDVLKRFCKRVDELPD